MLAAVVVFEEYSTQNSFSLFDFDKDYIDNSDNNNDEHGEMKRVNGGGGGEGSGLLPRRDRVGIKSR